MTVFVTGASAGFGAAVARKFVSEGDRVVAPGRRQERLLAPYSRAWLLAVAVIS